MRAAHRRPGIAARALRCLLALLGILPLRRPHRDPGAGVGVGAKECRASLAGNGYLCEVIAWQSGTADRAPGREIFLAGSWQDTPQTSLRWLTAQADRLANRLDPHPQEAWAQGLLSPMTTAAGNAENPAHTLRTWARATRTADPRQAAAHQLRHGEPIILAVRDHDAFYALAARPAVTPRPTANPPAPTPVDLTRATA